MSDVFTRTGRGWSASRTGCWGAADAEDVAHDAYVRWVDIDGDDIESPAAYLTTITTRLAINWLKSARHRRETYPGPWLPEPVVTELGADPADLVAEAEQLSVAALVALERLNPVERAVLLLRDVLDLDYAEIAPIVEKSPANCRQIASRARDRAGDLDRPSKSSIEGTKRLIADYLEAMNRGDLDAMKRLFAEDVILWSDGGGNVRAAMHPLSGGWRVARHLVGVAHWTPDDARIQAVWVNGDPGFVVRVADTPLCVTSFEVADATLIGIRVVVNPDKLRHLAN